MQVTGIVMDSPPIIRMSWLFCMEWMIVPAHTNSKALNKAWVIRWKKAIMGEFNPNAINIIPNCLRVERAITFFRSFSYKAERLAIIQVVTPM